MPTSILRLTTVAIVVAASASASASTWYTEPVTSGTLARGIEVDSRGIVHANVSGASYFQRDANGWAPVDAPGVRDFAIDSQDNVLFYVTELPDLLPELRDYSVDPPISIPIRNTRVAVLQFVGFDSLDRPHVVYNDGPAQELRHAFLDGGVWNDRLIATNPTFRLGNAPFHATLDTNDELHAIWSDSNRRLIYAQPTSSGWTTESIFPRLGISFAYGIQIDESGSAHIAYPQSGLFYATNESGDWQAERMPEAQVFAPSRADIVLDGNDEPNIFAYDADFQTPIDLTQYEPTPAGSWDLTVIDSYVPGPVGGRETIRATYGGGGFHVLYATNGGDVFYATNIPEPAAAALMLLAGVATLSGRRP